MTTLPQQPSPKRIASIDTLRGLTILTMLFVNNLESVPDAPGWMKHYQEIRPDGSINWHANGMTFVDLVFPAFLFLVGMAIPFAIGRRFDKGEPIWKVWSHVLTRTFGLLLCGVFMCNMYIDPSTFSGPLSFSIWKVLAFTFMIMAFLLVPKEGRKQKLFIGLRIGGFIGLGIMYLLFKTTTPAVEGGEEVVKGMQTMWWGILGLIGWAYLVACLAYTAFRNNVAAQVGVMAILYCLYLADQAQPSLTSMWTKDWIGISSMLGSHAAITVSGLILGIMLRPDSPLKGHWQRMRWTILYGIGMAVVAVLIYRFRSVGDMDRIFRINKNLATPTWCLICSAITCWVWVAIYWLMDVQGWKKWAVVFQPAGESPLMAYILESYCLAILALIGLFHAFEGLGENAALGISRAIIWAFAITFLAGFLKKITVQLRL